VATILKALMLSGEASVVIQRWVREVNLHGVSGKPVCLRRACEVILEDFAHTLVSSEESLVEEDADRASMFAPPVFRVDGGDSL